MADIVETCCGGVVSQVMKKYVGVSRHKNRWRARVRDPKLRTTVCLGSYTTPEEAALVVQRKRLEFQAMYGVLVSDDKRTEFWDSQETKTEISRKLVCLRDQTGVVNVPRGVRRIPNGKWVARIRDTVAKTRIWLGTYNTVEEAVSAYYKKKDLLDAKMTATVNLPCGVRRLPSGKWAARIGDPVAKTRNWVGTYNTVEEAFTAYCKKKELLDAKMLRTVFDDASEFRCNDKPDYKTTATSVKFERELGYDCRTSQLSTDCLNNIGAYDESKHGCGLIHSSPTSVFDVENSISEPESAKTYALNFDIADGSSDVVNEYGQLLGQFVELDEQMWLSLPD